MVEEKSAAGKTYVKLKKADGAGEALGWTAKTNLGSAKEFDATMKPDDAVGVENLAGLELLRIGYEGSAGALSDAVRHRLTARFGENVFDDAIPF